MQEQAQATSPDPFVEGVLARAIADQCTFALMAIDDLVRAEQDSAQRDIGTWYALQNFLIAAANISKLLWGTKAEIEKRRVGLRNKLGVDDTFAIKDRALRNDFEHFDERVEEKCSTTHVFIGRNIAPKGIINVGPQADHFQQYDPQSGELTFWTHSVSLPSLLQEIQFLLPHAQKLGKR